MVHDASKKTEGAKESLRVRVSRFVFCQRFLHNDTLSMEERVEYAFSDESYICGNHCGSTTWGLKPKAWLETVYKEIYDSPVAPALADITLAGCALPGGVSVSVPKAGRGDRVVIVDAITREGRLMRKHVDGQVKPCGKLWVFLVLCYSVCVYLLCWYNSTNTDTALFSPLDALLDRVDDVNQYV
jgi:hypothetical protein